MACEDGNEGDVASPEEFFEVEEIFINVIEGPDGKVDINSDSVSETTQDNENHEVVWKELDNHSFEDWASDEVNNNQLSRLDSTENALENREDSSISSAIPNVSDSTKTKAVIHVKSEEAENSQDWESTPMQRKIEKQGSQQKLGADVMKQKSEKPVSPTSKRQPISSSKPATDGIGAKSKLKQQDSQGTQLRMAKATAASRWIPPNKGSYTNSMHVSYPPSRYNSAPPVLAQKEPPQNGGKLKGGSSNTAASGAKSPAKDISGVDVLPAKQSSLPPIVDSSPIEK